MSIPQIRYRIFGREGTVDHLQMRDLIRHGEVTPLTDIVPEGSEEWQAAGNDAELKRYFELFVDEHRSAIRPPTGFDRGRAIDVLMIVAGFVFAITSLDDFRNGIASSRWPTAEARLIYTQAYNPSTLRRWGAQLFVSYSYFVNGQKYHSQAISFGSEFDRAVHQLYRFRDAKPLLAYYDPSMPTRAVLDPGITFGSAGTLLAGVIVMLVGGFRLRNPNRRWLENHR